MKKNKLFIPLVSGRKGMNQLINAFNIKSLIEFIPKQEKIVNHLIQQGKRKEQIDDFNKDKLAIHQKKFEFDPLVIRISVERFNEIEGEIKKLKPGHIFFNKAFDLIIDSQLNTPIVQITI